MGAGRLARLDAPEERLKRFIQVGRGNLQDMAVNLLGEGVGLLNVLDLRQLLIFADAALLGFVSRLALGQTLVIPTTARLDCLGQRLLLRA